MLDGGRGRCRLDARFKVLVQLGPYIRRFSSQHVKRQPFRGLDPMIESDEAQGLGARRFQSVETRTLNENADLEARRRKALARGVSRASRRNHLASCTF